MQMRALLFLVTLSGAVACSSGDASRDDAAVASADMASAQSDGSATDAFAEDAGLLDASPRDATSDATAHDAALLDATPDAMLFDASPRDASEDAPIVAPFGTSFDLRTTGAIGAVKNVGDCSAHGAFAFTTALAASWQLQGNTLYNLSDQEIVDCIAMSCDAATDVESWIDTSPVLTTAASYPYIAREGTCRSGSVSHVLGLASYDHFTLTREAIVSHLHDDGPVIVYVNVPDAWFTADATQVQDRSAISCSGGTTYTALIVGYGDDEPAGPYWILRFSLGVATFDAGYLRVSVGASETCAFSAMGYTLTAVAPI